MYNLGLLDSTTVQLIFGIGVLQRRVSAEEVFRASG